MNVWLRQVKASDCRLVMPRDAMHKIVVNGYKFPGE